MYICIYIQTFSSKNDILSFSTKIVLWYSLELIHLVLARITHKICFVKAIRKATGSGIFLGLIWGQISAPSQFKNEQKLPKFVYIIPNFSFLLFDGNFMKIQIKILKSQMHKICIKCERKPVFVHIFMHIFTSYYEICYSFALLISYLVLIHLKWRSSSFQVFPILMVQMLFNRPLTPTSKRQENPRV